MFWVNATIVWLRKNHCSVVPISLKLCRLITELGNHNLLDIVGPINILGLQYVFVLV